MTVSPNGGRIYGTVPEQARRREQIDAIRLTRRLTENELAEAERLTSALYMREYRAQRQERFGHSEALRKPRAAKQVST